MMLVHPYHPWVMAKWFLNLLWVLQHFTSPEQLSLHCNDISMNRTKKSSNLEYFRSVKVAKLDNFRALKSYNLKDFRTLKSSILVITF